MRDWIPEHRLHNAPARGDAKYTEEAGMDEAQEDQIRSEIYDELYSMLDRGLGKRDAGALIGIIERLIDLHKSDEK